ncbi:MAG TPA: hypothetical protein VD841_04390 [Arthrobacter sp.]|nr:hypothetical protein [Arthrobacter sp.]
MAVPLDRLRGSGLLGDGTSSNGPRPRSGHTRGGTRTGGTGSRGRRRTDGRTRRNHRLVGPVGASLALVVVRILDVAGVDVIFVVVWLGFVGPCLAENFTPERIREERFDIRRVGCDHQVQKVGGRSVVGDQVRCGFGDTQVKDLDRAGTFAGGHFAGALGNLLGIVRAGYQNADRTVENLIHPVQHQILVV